MSKSKKSATKKGTRSRNELVVAMLLTTKPGAMKDRRRERGGSKKPLHLQDSE